MIDTAAPEITLDTLKGTEVWYDAGMDLSVAADDGKDGSQVAEISCYANGGAIGWTDQSRAVFRIEPFQRSPSGRCGDICRRSGRQ